SRPRPCDGGWRACAWSNAGRAGRSGLRRSQPQRSDRRAAGSLKWRKPEVAILIASNEWTDQAVIEHVLAGETALFEVLMRRYNQRLYRLLRAWLLDSNEAEDVLQEAYVR